APRLPLLRSGLCKEADLQSPAFQAWGARLKWRPTYVHRKWWELCFIIQALSERGFLREGSRGWAFAVRTEPLPARFAGLGCTIVATDLDEGTAKEQGWVATNQHASQLKSLSRPSLCDPEVFFRRVSFRTVNMNAIPGDLRDFDFVWSTCSLEHLG